MSGDDTTISKRTDRNGTSYDLEHEGRHVRVRFRGQWGAESHYFW
jgi:hypothetical protein